jgi:hypothetical protein
MVLPV